MTKMPQPDEFVIVGVDTPQGVQSSPGADGDSVATLLACAVAKAGLGL